jgi:hypothetical protein
MRQAEVGRSSAGATGVVTGGNSCKKPSFSKVATSLFKVANIRQFWHQTGLVLPVACASSRSSQWYDAVSSSTWWCRDAADEEVIVDMVAW